MAKPFSLAAMLGSRALPVDIVDVGAMSLGEGTDAYHPLVAIGKARVVGFEPIREECEKLNSLAKPGQRFLPYFIGDGTKKMFRRCNFAMTSSLFEPNLRVANMFNNLGELMIAEERTEVQTRRLDDVAEISSVDFLKIDVQGAEVDVISGAERLLKNCLVVHTEVEFVPLYEGQPLFAEVDQAMRGAGFLLHALPGIAKRAFKPIILNNDVNQGLNQVLWADAVYVRDFSKLSELSPEQLLKLAVIVHEVYGSLDLAGVVLAEHDRQTGEKLWDVYLQKLLTPAAPPPPPQDFFGGGPLVMQPGG